MRVCKFKQPSKAQRSLLRERLNSYKSDIGATIKQLICSILDCSNVTIGFADDGKLIKEDQKWDHYEPLKEERTRRFLNGTSPGSRADLLAYYQFLIAVRYLDTQEYENPEHPHRHIIDIFRSIDGRSILAFFEGFSSEWICRVKRRSDTAVISILQRPITQQLAPIVSLFQIKFYRRHSESGFLFQQRIERGEGAEISCWRGLAASQEGTLQLSFYIGRPEPAEPWLATAEVAKHSSIKFGKFILM